MRVTAFVATIMIGIGGAVALSQAGQQGGRGRGQGPVILEQAPTDRSVAIPKEKLSQYLKDMDAKQLATLRMIEGGKFNVNIRRIRDAETALVHPNTIDLWVVLDGGGTITTGGRLEDRQIVGGESNSLRVGDVNFTPAGVPHGVSGVDGNVTWLNVRWDVDWPADAPLSAGRARGAVPAGGLQPLEYAPTDRAVYISKEKLAQYLKDMDAKQIATLRMIEGGKFNVNIRRIRDAETALVHPNTIDLWVVLDGSGTITTGGKLEDRQIVGGQSHPLKVGDVEFIPAGLPHGVSGVDGNITWLNVRWDVDWTRP